MARAAQAPRSPYKEELAAIGSYFDQQLYRGIFVAEMDEGYVGKARPAEEEAELHAEGFTFPYDDIKALIATTGQPVSLPGDGPPLCPSGYGLFMRAVGEMCDRAGASSVSVLEVTSGFVLGFNAKPKGGGRATERRRYHLDRVGIDELTNHVEG